MPRPKSQGIDEYSRKRDFTKTPEPGPDISTSSGPLRFCVQRHDATRLHYDFRLEVDGVLKSWAVPKGPTLDPTKKQLAMHVEDHPMDYGGFEGNIPKGEYGGGSVMLWDRGTYEVLGDMPARDQLARGDFKIRLHGHKLKGDFGIVLMKGRGKGNEWLLLKKRDEHAHLNWDVEQHARSVLTGRTQEEIAQNLPGHSEKQAADLRKIKGAVKTAMPGAITPMMAQLADQPPAGPDWCFEVKWDGVRALCFIDQGELRIFSRNGNRCERQYPEVMVLPHHVRAGTAIIDAEIAVLDDKGRASFGMIQPRISQRDPNSVAHLARSTPVTFFAFDLLYCDGYDLRGATLADRKSVLESIFEPSDRIRLSPHFTTDGDAMLEAARQAGLEGIVAKRVSSKYESRRSSAWLKIKIHQEQEFVVCGFTHGERDYFSSLVLGVYDGGKLIHAGQVGTGFTDKTLREIHERLHPLIIPKSPLSRGAKIPRGVTWVRPEIVCQVRFTEWTHDDQLRAPSFQGLREDVNPASVQRESPASVESSEPETAVPEPEAEVRPPLLPPAGKELLLAVGKQTLKFTNLDKIFYPDEGYTKRDVINYYDAVADLLVPHLRDRPLSLKRYPNGIAKDFFFQKNAGEFAAPWMRLEPIETDSRTVEHVIANDRESLLFLANLGCIDQNPWMSRVGSLDRPDFMLIDLDPQECSYDRIVEAALLVRRKLDELGLAGYPKTTGGDGMHIYVPLENEYTYAHVRSFCEIVSHLVIAEKPDLFTTPRAVAKRKHDRVYFDYLQIAEGKTISAPYVLRAYPGAPVSTPLDWREVKPGLLPKQFTIENAPARFAAVGDLFRPVLENRQRLEPAIERMQKLMGGS